ncbi:MAG: bifunctional diaminohydroxyphosphoribosylaminopyrimidine deaminase/5-amino-6-(5-phosphoribosylamino)uracil reductase RibD [Rhodospirillaceae bacterium]|nr:bifunctional diaminohydroxyphosphoribosylaminopyrimidine deaminase/5-amino-6-(5-phosphoribosylamino)uracil reductase RibD [Rhodospirillaceae bacterium]
MTVMNAGDLGYMKNALALASRGLGTTAPNPSVGCVIVNDGVVVGRGWTQPSGRPHAETQALRVAGLSARGATAYVSLEPCCHHAQTPPCTDAFIESGVSRVVIASSDPDGRVDGGGIAALRAAGVDVESGVLSEDSSALNAGFFKVLTHKMPFVALKSATSLDGRIALKNGESEWITGYGARNYGHLLRSQYDAILVGSGTVDADDPSLTCRLPGIKGGSPYQPVRVVLDRRLRISETSKLVSTSAIIPTWILTGANADSVKVGSLRNMGVEIFAVTETCDAAFARAALALLAKRGVTRVLIEGGGQVAASFLSEGLIDRIYAFRAPIVVGGDGRVGVGALELSQLSDAPRFEISDIRSFGSDVLEILDREPTF